MRNWLRDKSRGLFAFLLVAGLVAGGLGWATAAALRLEREQWQARAEVDQANRLRVARRDRDQQERIRRREQERQQAEIQEEFAARLRLALWRLDSRFAPVLAREDARPYNHFSALFAPAVALDQMGCVSPPGTIFEPSPLLNADLPEWMLLHFQTTAEAGWGSPQVLSESQDRQLRQTDVSLANVHGKHKRLLAELAASTTSQTLLEMVRREEARLASSRPTFANFASPAEVVPDNERGQPQPLAAANSTQQMANPNSLLRSQGMGYPNRAYQKTQTDLHNLAQQAYGDNAYAVWNNTINGKALPVRLGLLGARQPVQVGVGPMLPLWLPPPAAPARDQQEQLVLARRVRLHSPELESWALLGCLPPGLPVNLAVGPLAEYTRKPPHPREVCQGIVLDWPRLRKLLAEEVSDLFPDARLLPMRTETPPHPERTMTMLPVELDPGASPERESPLQDVDWLNDLPLELQSVTPPELGWTPLRIGLALAWAAALVALSAVALGGWSLIDLSQRRIRFVSAVTHELRTPLTTLRLYLDMLTGGMVQGEEQRAEYLHTLHAESDRLTRLVNNVLDFSRLENQRPRLELVPLSLAALLEQLRATWQTRCQDVGKELILDNGLAEEALVRTDVYLVQQILGNLIDNACKYSRGAEDARLWLRARPGENGRLWLEVEDRGPGVPPAERRSIFRAFSRGRGADVTAGGVGLGLALAQRWARLLGGSLRLHCRAENAGACFCLELPQAGG